MQQCVFIRRSVLLIVFLFISSIAHPVLAETPRINLQNADIRVLIAAVSKITKKNFVIDPAVRGQVTFESGRGLDEEELYDVFLSILQVQGLEAIESGNVIKIIPSNKARGQVAPVIPAPTEQAPQQQLSADKTVTQVYKLQYIPVNTAIQTLQPLAGQGETRIQFNQASNSVIITGRGQNVSRLTSVLRDIDRPNNQSFELVKLRHSSANQLAQTLRGLMASGKTANGGAVPQRVYISVDERTNSILVAGNKADRERMRQVISRLDVPRTRPNDTQVVKLRHASARSMLQTLNQLQLTPQSKDGNVAVQQQVRLSIDERTNSILISGEKSKREPILAAIARLDVPRTRPADTQVIKLRNAVASQLLKTLNQLNITPQAKEGQPAEQQIRLAADDRTNSIIISGEQSKRAPIVAAIARLDVPPSIRPSDTQVIRLTNAIASQLLQTLNQLQITPQVKEGEPVERQVRLAADDRTNSIIISGERAKRVPIIAAIKRLDTARNRPADTQVVPVKYAVATQVLDTLKQLQVAPPAGDGKTPVGQQVLMAADARTNSILISGNKVQRDPIVAAIRRLDTPRNRAGRTEVINLRYANAEELTTVLTSTAQGIQQQAAGTAQAAKAAGNAVASSASASSSGNISIQADKASNSVIVTAPSHVLAELKRVISQLDRRQTQILVEAIIAEVSTNLSRQLGAGLVANGISGSSSGIAGYSNLGSGLNTLLSLTQGATSIPGGFLLGLGNEKFALVLEALKGDAATNILSTPTLVTLDNEEASIVVGQNVPFLTGAFTSDSGTASNPFQTIQREDVGITLKVTPQVNRDRTIRMKIEQEVSTIATSSNSASDLITNKRTINTNVMVEDGQILVLGGLIQDDFTDTENKIPVLSDIPVIGGLFKNNTTTKNKQNLMAFIHPVIMPDRKAADAYTRSKYYNLQRQQASSQILNRGNNEGRAAIFPPLNERGSVDNLHFSQQPVRQAGQAAQSPQVARKQQLCRQQAQRAAKQQQSCQQRAQGSAKLVQICQRQAQQAARQQQTCQQHVQRAMQQHPAKRQPARQPVARQPAARQQPPAQQRQVRQAAPQQRAQQVTQPVQARSANQAQYQQAMRDYEKRLRAYEQKYGKQRAPANTARPVSAPARQSSSVFSHERER